MCSQLVSQLTGWNMVIVTAKKIVVDSELFVTLHAYQFVKLVIFLFIKVYRVYGVLKSVSVSSGNLENTACQP